MWVFPWIKLLIILALCKANLDGSFDSSNFPVTGYLPLIREDSVTYMYGLAVYVKEGLPFVWDLSPKNLWIFTYAFDWLYFIQWLTSFSSIDHFLCHYAVFCSLSSNIDQFLSINASATAFVFGKFNVHNKDYLTYSGDWQTWWTVTILTGHNIGHNYKRSLSQMTIPRWLTFLPILPILGFLTVTLIILLFSISFFLLTLEFVLKCLSLH